MRMDNVSLSRAKSALAGWVLFAFTGSTLLCPAAAFGQDSLRVKAASESPAGLEQLEDRLKEESRPAAAGMEEKEKEAAALTLEEFMLLQADYGFLPDDHPAVRFLQERLALLLPEMKPEDLPPVRVLASTGEGVNAMVFPDGTMVVSPEMIRFVGYTEELDFALLHEINHWRRKHAAAIRRAPDVWARSGLSRYAEIEADIAAFLQMSEEERGTNPLGALCLLQRLDKEAGEGMKGLSSDFLQRWDVAHGEGSRRVVRLKRILRIVDVMRPQGELTPMPEEVLSSLGSLPLGGRLSRLVRRPPPHGREWDQWKQEIGKILESETSTPPLLHAAMRLLHERARELILLQDRRGLLEVEKRRLESYLQALQMVFRRWVKDPIAEGKGGMPGPKQLAWKALLLEAAAGIPVLTEPKDPVAGMIPELAAIGRAFRNSLQSREVLGYLTECCSDLGEFPVERSALFQFAAEAVQMAIGPQAAFDQQDKAGKTKVDVPDYLSRSAALIGAASAAAARCGVSLRGQDPWSARDAWTAAVCGGVFALADVNAWEEWKVDYGDRVRSFSAQLGDEISSLDPVRIGSLLMDFERRAPKTLKAVEGFAFEMLGVIPAPAAILQELEALPGSHSVEHEILVRTATLLNSLPPALEVSFVEKHMPSFLRPHESVGRPQDDVSAGDIAAFVLERLSAWEATSPPTVEDRADWIAWNLAVCRDDTGLVSDPVLFERIVTLGNLPLEDFNRLADTFSDPGTAGSRLGVPSRLEGGRLHPEANAWWCHCAIIPLVNSLQAAGSPEEFFELISGFAKRWSMADSFYPTQSPGLVAPGVNEAVFETKQAIVRRGVEYLGLAKPEFRPEALAPADLERLLALSFFMEDAVMQRRLQEHLLSRIARELEFKEAVDLVLVRYRAQGFLAEFSVLEALDERAQKPDVEIDYLEQATRGMLLPSAASFSRIGKGIALEAAMQVILRSKDLQEILAVLVGTGRDDNRLRELLMKNWERIYGEPIKKELEQLITELSSVEDLKSLPGKPPGDWAGPDGTVPPNGKAIYFSPEGLLRMLQRLGPMERAVLLDLLLGGSQGVLATAGGRQRILEQFFAACVDEAQEPEVAALLKQVLGALFEAAPPDELQLVLEHLLLNRICLLPTKPGSWEAQARRLGKDAANNADPDEVAKAIPSLQNPTNAKKAVSGACTEWWLGVLNGTSSTAKSELSWEEILFRVVPPELYQRQAESMAPMDLLLMTAGLLGAPGKRFLQLLGHTVDIPPPHGQKLLKVFDSYKGQHKVGVKRMLERELPELARRIRYYTEWLGGGSLYTVYEVVLDDNSRWVVKVLDPNAWYHAQIHIGVLRDTLALLAQQDERFAQAQPLLEFLEEWIREELEDPTYEEDDQRYRERWDGQAIADWTPRKIVIPEIQRTGTPYVRVERVLKGDNFTKLGEWSPEEQKGLMALACQHYLLQIAEGLAHPNISPGNLMRLITVDEVADLGVVDRGMKLKVFPAERAFLLELVTLESVEEKAGRFVSELCSMPGNSKVASELDQEALAQKIVQAVGATPDPGEWLRQAMISVHGAGLHVPLKLRLLFLNLNVLHEMAKEAGFPDGFPEAVAYNGAGMEGVEAAQERVREKVDGLYDAARKANQLGLAVVGPSIHRGEMPFLPRLVDGVLAPELRKRIFFDKQEGGDEAMSRVLWASQFHDEAEELSAHFLGTEPEFKDFETFSEKTPIKARPLVGVSSDPLELVLQMFESLGLQWTNLSEQEQVDLKADLELIIKA